MRMKRKGMNVIISIKKSQKLKEIEIPGENPKKNESTDADRKSISQIYCLIGFLNSFTSSTPQKSL